MGQGFDNDKYLAEQTAAIIERLDLLRPIYSKTCNYGHFGRELPELTWERTDLVEELKQTVK